MRRLIGLTMLAARLAPGIAAAAAETPAAEWLSWRGPGNTGAAAGAVPPLTWSEDSNVAWRLAVPGRGHSTPVVSGGRVYLTTALKTDRPNDPGELAKVVAALEEWQRKMYSPPTHGLQLAVLCAALEDGRLLWRRDVREAMPYAGTHGGGSWASGSPVTDGRRVYATFGSYGLYCLDMDGNPVWQTDLGVLRTRNNFGEGASPALAGDALFVACDQEGDSFIVALDARTGAERWRRARQEPTAWSTPLVLESGGRTQVVVSATQRIRAYDAAGGEELWACGGMTQNVIPCPVRHGSLLIAMSGFRGNALLAIDLDRAAGDITDRADALRWRINRNTPYVPSPVLDGGRLYFLNHNKGVLSCLDAATGKPDYEAQALPGLGGVHSSPVSAAGRLYISDLAGTTVVVAAGPDPRVLATNRLNDKFTASAVPCGDRLLLRGHERLYCLRDAAGR